MYQRNQRALASLLGGDRAGGDACERLLPGPTRRRRSPGGVCGPPGRATSDRQPRPGPLRAHRSPRIARHSLSFLPFPGPKCSSPFQGPGGWGDLAHGVYEAQTITTKTIDPAAGIDININCSSLEPFGTRFGTAKEPPKKPPRSTGKLLQIVWERGPPWTSSRTGSPGPPWRGPCRGGPAATATPRPPPSTEKPALGLASFSARPGVSAPPPFPPFEFIGAQQL